MDWTLSTFLIYFITHKYSDNKYIWLFAVAAIFIHSTSIFFVFMLVIVKISGIDNGVGFNKIIRSIIIVIFLSVFSFYSFSFLSSVSMGIPALHYVFERIESDQMVDLSYIDANEWLVPNMLLYLTLAVSLFIMILYKIEKNTKLLIIIYFIYFIFMMYLLNTDNYLLAYRMMIYLYMFLPFILIYPLIYFKGTGFGLYVNLLYFVVIIFSIVRFFRFLTLGTWSYAPLSQILFYPPILYF